MSAVSPRARLALSLAAAILSALTTAIAAQGMVGHVARQVDLLALFAGGVGAGAGLASAAVALRRARA